MANARTRFDTICDYLGRAHETSTGTVYGKPCAMHTGRAFIAFHMDGMGFKVRGRIRLQALALSGAKFWDPLLPDRPDPDWVWIPSTYFLSWDRLAVEAFRQQKEQGDNAVARLRPVQASAPLIVRTMRPDASETPAFTTPVTNTPLAVRVAAATAGARPEPPPAPQTRPLPNWAERLKQLTGWMKWTTSGREG